MCHFSSDLLTNSNFSISDEDHPILSDPNRPGIDFLFYDIKFFFQQKLKIFDI